jgi:hypothetical protein
MEDFKTTECIMDLEKQSKMVITTFKLSVVFRGNWYSCVNWPEPKIERP